MIVRCLSCGTDNRIPASKLDKNGKCGHCHAPLGPVDEPYVVSSAAEFGELIADAPFPILVDFWAAWCGPCKMVAPELAKLAKERKGALLVAKVNSDDHPDVASRYGIQALPTFVLFRSGQEAGRASGAMPAGQIVRAVGLT